jgi:hypothetical protein
VEETKLLVKPRFRQKKRAADALQHAFTAHNVKEYHERLLKCFPSRHVYATISISTFGEDEN